MGGGRHLGRQREDVGETDRQAAAALVSAGPELQKGTGRGGGGDTWAREGIGIHWLPSRCGDRASKATAPPTSKTKTEQDDSFYSLGPYINSCSPDSVAAPPTSKNQQHCPEHQRRCSAASNLSSKTLSCPYLFMVLRYSASIPSPRLDPTRLWAAKPNAGWLHAAVRPASKCWTLDVYPVTPGAPDMQQRWACRKPPSPPPSSRPWACRKPLSAAARPLTHSRQQPREASVSAAPQSVAYVAPRRHSKRRPGVR